MGTMAPVSPPPGPGPDPPPPPPPKKRSPGTLDTLLGYPIVHVDDRGLRAKATDFVLGWPVTRYDAKLITDEGLPWKLRLTEAKSC